MLLKNTIVLIFRSGTGKSHLLKALVSRLPSKTPVGLVNVRSDESCTYEKLHRKIRSFKLESLNKVPKKSFLIVEDIVFMTGKQELGLRHCLNYDSHHKSIKLFCVSHTIHKTKIFSMLPLFHYIVFTSSKSNVPVLRFTLDYFKIDKEIRDRWLDFFAKADKQGVYFVFDCTSINFFWSENYLETCRPVSSQVSRETESGDISSSSGSPSNGRESTVKRFEKFVEGHPNKSKARALFSVCARSHAKIDPYDFTVTFGAGTDGAVKKISVVDYILCLLSDLPKAAIELDLFVLHKYFTVRHLCVFPKAFIVNRYFKNVAASV